MCNPRSRAATSVPRDGKFRARSPATVAEPVTFSLAAALQALPLSALLPKPSR
jgi:hypothetical protein